MINRELLLTKGEEKTVVSSTNVKRRYFSLFLAILLGYVLLQVILIKTLAITYDEGINLQVGYLINRGYEPYTEIFTLANPLFIWFIGLLGKLELSPTGFKFIFLVFGLLLLTNTTFIANTLFGRQVALATFFLLATATTFLAETATGIVAVLPALSIATLSLVFTIRYSITKQMAWLFFSGTTWGIALFFSTHVLNIALVAPIFIIFFVPTFSGNRAFGPDWGRVYKPVGIWLMGSLISLAIGVFLATPDIIFDHLLRNQAIIRENLPVAQEDNFRLVGQFVTFNFWLFLFAAYGLVRIYEQLNHTLWIVFVWGLLSFAWLMLQITLRLVDLAILLPPLAIMAGWGLTDFGHRLIRWKSAFRPGVSFLLIGFFLYAGWQQINNYIYRDIDTIDDLTQLEQRQDIVRFIHQHTNINDCVIVDDAALAIAANRLPAPQLVELSQERIAGGLITTEALQKLTIENNCTAVVFSKRRYTLPLSDFRDWAGTYYPNKQEFTRTDIYYQ